MALTLHECKTSEEVRTLIANGADIEEINRHTPLAIACELGNFEVVVELCRLGANINYTYWEYITPVAIASLYGHIEIVKYLISIGADYSHCLRYASYGNHSDIVDFLLDDSSINTESIINTRNGAGTTPLMAACLQGDIYIVERILISGGDVNAIEKTGDNIIMSMLSCQCRIQCSHIIKLLIIYGINVFHLDNKGKDLNWHIENNAEFHSHEYLNDTIDAIEISGFRVKSRY